ncbi:MAG TPA: helix-turn-helix domain-containing protein [Nocardioidaceae bacterium]|nr:helix-turn-helix domain-containing protein [Nocardioidaceae bacterium]
MSLEVSSLRALAHPTRLQILSLLTGASMSAADIARELDITQANASYHLRQLAAVDLIEEAGERKIRGGVAKLYRYPWERPPMKLPADEAGMQPYVQALANEMVRRFGLQYAGQGMSHYTDAEMWVDPGVWREVLDTTGEASHRLHAEAKPPGSEGTIRVSMSAVLFPMRPTNPASDEGES